jgi:3-oxoacyl-[acyl-carrier protein] reductase
LAKAGCKVVVGYNSSAAGAEHVAAELPGNGHRTARMPTEDTAAMRDVAAMVEREYGRCGVLVNSTGFTRMIPHADLEVLTDELIDAIFVANVRGPFATIRAFSPLMKRSDAGVIINISPAAALSGGGSNIAYGASKVAIDTMSKSLARVLGPNIRVLSVSPGAVDTGFVPSRTTEMVEKAAQGTPEKRVVQADEVAQTVMAAVTHMTATTGTVLLVEAGSLL